MLVHQLKLPQRWSQEREEEEGREDEDTETNEKEKSRETFWPVEINDINSTKQLVVVKLAVFLFLFILIIFLHFCCTYFFCSYPNKCK